MSGRCMCGDSDCPSCGAAQGTKTSKPDPTKVRMVFSASNQAWFISRGPKLLTVIADREKAEEYMDKLCGKDWRG